MNRQTWLSLCSVLPRDFSYFFLLFWQIQIGIFFNDVKKLFYYDDSVVSLRCGKNINFSPPLGYFLIFIMNENVVFHICDGGILVTPKRTFCIFHLHTRISIMKLFYEPFKGRLDWILKRICSQLKYFSTSLSSNLLKKLKICIKDIRGSNLELLRKS